MVFWLFTRMVFRHVDTLFYVLKNGCESPTVSDLMPYDGLVVQASRIPMHRDLCAGVLASGYDKKAERDEKTVHSIHLRTPLYH